MASIRTARVIAAVSALPLAAALFGGVAAADNGIALADDGSNAGVATLSGVIFDNYGNSATTQQQANGSGASNQSNTAQVKGSPFTVINQGNQNTAVTFAPLWW
ncbi:hypothetical protein GR925_20280 [Streptomyces sp. HUCO-GS316]|uniref:hypothetical protein n=1 Tax=Streptomyces sp. HUCO-GS316 TaxID=2692198 RepID=UPI0013694BC4|nr:hypothetical protein [Streptomyces sp. HUCO-GS316]MXM65725.1 hypothetical protein [Streptomyces sp. HUCO-GS316]